MKFILVALFSIGLMTASPVVATSHACDCSESCAKKCDKGNTENCECKSGDCKKDSKCTKCVEKKECEKCDKGEKCEKCEKGSCEKCTKKSCDRNKEKEQTSSTPDLSKK